HLLDRFDFEFFGVTLTTHDTSYLGLIMRLGGVYETRGDSEGNLLVTDAQKKTFGGSISRLSKSEHIPNDVLERFQALLKDRNWLVHSSNADSKKALDDDVAYSDLHRRLQSMLDEAGRLLKEISALSEKFVLSHGVSVEALEARIAERLGEWQS
ncbi:hypothetical protein, partial [Pseudomonas putida]|uniref:hypothetical protein n=1 Tax=Pseudomonas putida TaxID=303 RepID=UPI0037C5E70F